jgi:hypothetical protein
MDYPLTLQDLIRCGGVEGLARQAARKAADAERRFWLPILENMADQLKPSGDSRDDLFLPGYLESEIRTLRRMTGIPAAPERKRAQTRERVRRWRQKQRET